jgi:hypothetical protein
MTVAELRNDLLLYAGVSVDEFTKSPTDPKIRAVWDEINREVLTASRQCMYGPYIEDVHQVPPERCEELRAKIFKIKVPEYKVH